MEKEQQKAQALLKIEELKRYISNDEIKKEIKLEIKSCDGEICFSSTKTTIKEAVIEAIESGANLHYANLYDANLRGAILIDSDLRNAEMENAKFYGQGGTNVLKKSQITSFLKALGFIIE